MKRLKPETRSVCWRWGERQCKDRSLEVLEGGRCLGVQTHLQECGEGRGRYAFWV